ncbi:MAG: IPT/TIG domain-containing protein [Bryobacteraceae bacterium]
MSDYSKSPLDVLVANQAKGYIGLHLEQAVPLLDRDLNLLQDLIYATVRSVFARYIGNGIPEGADGFAIQASATPQDFVIKAAAAGPGTYMAGGVEVAIAADTDYISQNAIALTTPAASRTDIVYLDISFSEVDGTVDVDLNNSGDVGMETSVRVKPVWIVRVAEGAPMPGAPAGHVYTPLAQLSRTAGNNTITAGMITDLRQSRMTVSRLAQRLATMETLLLLPAFAPSPNQFTPKIGAPGTNVTLFGNVFNLQPVSVRFGGAAASIVGTPAANQIIVTVPNVAPQASTITVQTAGGTATSVDTFQIVPPAPTFNASPNQFTPKLGAPGINVTLLGNNFNAGAVKVLFGTTAAAIVGPPTAGQIVATVPNMAVGAVAITVQTGGGQVTSVDTFNVT